MWVDMCACLSAHSMEAVPAEATRGCQVPWVWWECWKLPESSTRAVSALNSRTILARIVVVLFWGWGFEVRLCTLVYSAELR